MTIVVSQNPYKVLNLREASEEEMLKTAKYFFDKRDSENLDQMQKIARKILYSGNFSLNEDEEKVYAGLDLTIVTYRKKIYELKRNPYPILTWISETLRELHEFTAPANGIIN